MAAAYYGERVAPIPGATPLRRMSELRARAYRTRRPAHAPGTRLRIVGVIRVIVSRAWVIDLPDDVVEELCSFGLSALARVLALAGEDRQELDAGAEVGAGFTG